VCFPADLTKSDATSNGLDDRSTSPFLGVDEFTLRIREPS
jgi:hypothetical protein